MKRKLGLLMLIGALMLSVAPVWADGEFYVIAGGGQAVGTKITSVPYVINQSGFYYLSGNMTITTNSDDGISVNADDVTLDLMGFSLVGNGIKFGINMNGRSNVEVRNGTVRNFYAGIGDKSDGTGANCRISNVRAFNNYRGIHLYGKNSLVQACNCSNNTYQGINVISGTVTGNVACDNPDAGITMIGAGSVIGNIANNNAYRNFSFNSNANILVDRNSASGLAINYNGMENKVIPGVNAGTP